jgi:hypothetical protein
MLEARLRNNLNPGTAQVNSFVPPLNSPLALRVENH